MMTFAELSRILQYDPETGKFVWNVSRPKVKIGCAAGYVHGRGYIHIEIMGKSYAAHRLAWLYMTGKMPANQIDHINRNKSDNRFANLREATHGQNRANSKTCNRHGLKGIRRLPWMKDGDRCWQAQITHNKKVHYLGCFYTKEEAHSAYCDAAKRMHGDFFNP
jgi:hypothetical protein